ncbi:MAG: PAS domain S-box protein [Desulfobacteraceae bacterium]|jgi:PAS domain S-box-containing protein|nr:PAS domain S-box protein [Desulfobacteraceae bacterium]
MVNKSTYEELEQRVQELEQAESERKKAEAALAAKVSLERIISKASRRFLTLAELDTSINACLADIGRFCRAGRAYLFQFASDGATMNNTHEWCAPGVKPEIENLQGLPLEIFPWWMKALEAGGNIHVKNVAELPPEARAEKEMLEAQQIKSVLVVPFLVENRLAGFLGFDNVASTSAWGEKELVPLRTLAEIIGAAVTRKHAEDALMESEERLRLQIERMPIALILWDHEFKVITWNPAAESIFGYASEEALGRHPYGMIVSRETQPIVDDVWRRLIEGDTTAHSLNENNTKDGRSIICSWTNTPIKNHQGSIIGVLSMVQDLTEQTRAEEERKNLQAQLIQAQKMEAIGTLAGGIAHNFNNILMGIQGRTSLMLMGKKPSDPDCEHLRGIEAYVKNAVELTRDLLGFARGGKYEVKPTDLNALIKHESRMFARTKREIRVHEKYEEDLWTVDVDQSQIKQALLNLYVNAWQAMPGEGDLYIQTENATFDAEYINPFDIAPGRFVKVSVADTGVGMDAATRERIFDPFFSTKGAGQGSGLGLASVYGIIKNHGGFIDVYSERGAGTTFTICLPASERKAEKEEPGPKRHEIQYGRGTVLFVDDEEMIVEVGQAMLKNLGYRAVIARSGQEALNLYEKQRAEIDLVILDMIMPGMGGGETYDRLREMDGDVKVLLSSGYSVDGQAKEILDRGCSGFIQKPFAMEELSRKVRELLDEVDG